MFRPNWDIWLEKHLYIIVPQSQYLKVQFVLIEDTGEDLFLGNYNLSHPCDRCTDKNKTLLFIFLTALHQKLNYRSGSSMLVWGVDSQRWARTHRQPNRLVIGAVGTKPSEIPIEGDSPSTDRTQQVFIRAQTEPTNRYEIWIRVKCSILSWWRQRKSDCFREVASSKLL